METSNPGGTSGGLSPIAGAAGTGLHNAQYGSKRKANPSGPLAAQTPQEALTHIDLLYKTGRMEDLATILRRSEVFREAWLILQQSVVTHPETSAEPGPVKLEGASEPQSISAFAKVLDPGGQLAYTLTKALQVYQSQLDYYDQERNSTLRISIRV